MSANRGQSSECVYVSLLCEHFGLERRVGQLLGRRVRGGGVGVGGGGGSGGNNKKSKT